VWDPTGSNCAIKINQYAPQKKYYIAHKEDLLRYNKQYRDKHKERINAKRRELYFSKTREKKLAYEAERYQKRKSEVREYNFQYGRAHKKEKSEYMKNYTRRKSEHLQEYRVQTREQRKEKLRKKKEEIEALLLENATNLRVCPRHPDIPISFLSSPPIPSLRFSSYFHDLYPSHPPLTVLPRTK
jgi:hypothetical protein